MTLSWSGPAPLNFWVEDRPADLDATPNQVSAVVDFSRPGEVLLYVGGRYGPTRGPTTPVSYRITTTTLPR